MKKKILFLIFLLSFFCLNPINIEAATNPYGKYQTLYGIKTVRCTWYAWQQAYEHTGVALPGWGNAQTWYNSAISDGYQVGSEAKANSIAVWSSSDGYGHVGFVVAVEGNVMTINEAGIVTEENEGIVNGSKKYTTAGNLIGFIYLEEAPSKNNGATSPNTNNNKIEESEEKSSNANLKSLSIDVQNLEFIPEETDYKVEVDYETQIINIKADAEDENAMVTGTGAKALKVGENNYKVTVTAEDKSTKDYNITVIRNELEDKEEEKEEIITEEAKETRNIVFLLCIIVASLIVIVLLIKIFLKKKGEKVIK